MFVADVGFEEEGFGEDITGGKVKVSVNMCGRMAFQPTLLIFG